MKALAFSNNDISVIAWTFGGKLKYCLGFAIYRIDVLAGTETALPAMATFKNQAATDGRSTEVDPVQKFFWKDVYAKRGGTYKYKIVPMGGTPGNLAPMPYGPLITNQIQLTPHYGGLSVYFNRGILATQATAKALRKSASSGQLVDRLVSHIYSIGDPLRNSLAGDMIEALKMLPTEAAKPGYSMKCAFYELDDPEIMDAIKPLGSKVDLILSNMPGMVNGQATNDVYATERAAMKAAGLNVRDRFMSSNHIGHNKFQILKRGNQAVAALFGSTNVTAHGLCAQTNNTVIAHSEKVAQAYEMYWDRLQVDTLATGKVTGPQSAPLRTSDAEGKMTVELEDGSGTVEIWYSPNTPKQRASKPGANEACPPDLAELFDLISKAQTAILFLVFEPGKPSVVDAIANALKAKPGLFVRGAVTDPKAADEFYIVLHEGQPNAKNSNQPQDARVIHTQGVTLHDAFGQWSAELNQAGHAVIHDKIVVIDPFTDNCVVAMGSHNAGYKASYNNDENLNFIKGHRAAAEAYAAHCLDVYDHYAFRYWLEQNGNSAWHFLSEDDKWQDGYFSPDNSVKSAELAFWLGAVPKGDALPTPHSTSSTRERPPIPAVPKGAGAVAAKNGAKATKAKTVKGEKAK